MHFTRRTTSGTRMAGMMWCDGAARHRSLPPLLQVCYWVARGDLFDAVK
jgi:hypothetical protein